MLRELPIFQDYTVDIRLKQFRIITKDKIEFINFNSKKGKQLLSKYYN